MKTLIALVLSLFCMTAVAESYSPMMIGEDDDVTLSRTFKAWCNPQADDDCYIDDKRVPIKDLPNQVPVINPAVRPDLRCDTWFCYDAQGPVGVNKDLVDRHANR